MAIISAERAAVESDARVMSAEATANLIQIVRIMNSRLDDICDYYIGVWTIFKRKARSYRRP
jgi:hypothetical protein